MTRHVGIAAVIVTLVVLAATGLVLAWHSFGGPTGTGTADLGLAPFSRPVGPNPPGYVTCLIGNFPALDVAFVPPPVPNPPPNPGHALEHHWKLFSNGPTPGPGNDGQHTIVIIIGATTVNMAQGSSRVRAAAVDAVGTKSVEVVHPLTFDGDTAFGLLALEVNEGLPYDLTIENINTDPNLPGQRHYKIGAAAPFVRLGYGHPLLEYLEPTGGPPPVGPQPQYWNVNAASGEAVTLTVSVDDNTLGAPGVPGQATSVDYVVVEQSPLAPVVAGPATSTIGPASPVAINFTNTGSFTRSYEVRIHANGHFKLEKSSSLDEGLYARNCPQQFPVIVVTIDIKPGSDPSCFNNDGNGTIPVAILSSTTFDATQLDPATVSLDGLTVKTTGKGNKFSAHIEDVNGDGLADLVVQIQDADSAFQAGSGTATLNGNLVNGQPIVGTGDICITQ